MNSESLPNRSVKLFLRADHDFGRESPQQRIVEQLSALEANGELDDYEVVVWGRELRLDGPLTETDYYRRVVDHVEEFEAWAAGTDVSVEYLFRRRRVESAFVDETYDLLSLPVALLAIYRDGDVAQVYPCKRTDGPRPITEFAKHFESILTLSPT
ncbi:HTH domain-containing protein [Halogeometricum luteum]|uniref:Uncharacterized protein n=1 Tax=Halogeometricum luteum TaxID=2950537 RepID=A0ABU2G389_9EURY|nr:HTH domain-containing protein [Halogeometricum sp. S3BR5-2]MDS0295252.1 hypothetical protein [Halogeometricum sp. S3BR5-2]